MEIFGMGMQRGVALEEGIKRQEQGSQQLRGPLQYCAQRQAFLKFLENCPYRKCGFKQVTNIDDL